MGPRAKKNLLDSGSKKQLDAATSALRYQKLEMPPADKHPEGEPHGDGGLTVRRAVYRGHEIEIHTSYRFIIDNEEVKAPISVGQDGRVQCHTLPNYSFASAVDLARMLAKGLDTPRPKDALGQKEGKPRSRR